LWRPPAQLVYLVLSVSLAVSVNLWKQPTMGIFARVDQFQFTSELICTLLFQVCLLAAVMHECNCIWSNI